MKRFVRLAVGLVAVWGAVASGGSLDEFVRVQRGGLIVTSPEGKPLDYSRWHRRVWKVALEGKPEYPGAKGHPPRPAIQARQLDERRRSDQVKNALGNHRSHRVIRMRYG